MADHGDHLTNTRGLSIDAPNYEITDFFIFSRGDKLVLTAAFDPSFPVSSPDVTWPENFDFRFNLDLDSDVQYGKVIDGVDFDKVAGGYISNPKGISEDIVLSVSFKDNKPVVKASGSNRYSKVAEKINASIAGEGQKSIRHSQRRFFAREDTRDNNTIKKPYLKTIAGKQVVNGIRNKEETSDRANSELLPNSENVSIYAGVRAEQFLFGPLVRRNRPTIAIEIDKKLIFDSKGDQTLLAWTQSIINNGEKYTDSHGMKMKADGGPYIDSMGRALRSQFPVDLRMINALHPSMHVEEGFVYPDVAIYDASKKAAFPNGRDLRDDVLTYLSTLENTTPPAILNGMGITDNENSNQGTLFAAEVELSLDPDSRYLGGADAGDIRTWATFPYHGLQYNIPQKKVPTYKEYLGSEFVHRFYDEVTGSFYYTSNRNDIAFWDSLSRAENQGIVFPAATYRGKAVHRFFNTDNGTYFWTIDPNEFDELKNKDNSK